RQSGLLRGACHRARIRATRWLAMTMGRWQSLKNKSPGRMAGARSVVRFRRSVALSRQLQQQREQFDKVRVERQRPGDGCPLGDVTARRSVAVDVVVLQPLRVP